MPRSGDVNKENNAVCHDDELEQDEMDTSTIAGVLETCVIVWEGIKDQLDKVCLIDGE